MGGLDLRWDLVIAGGGLAGGLLAYRLRQTHPNLKLRVLEAGDRLGGNHTWSFHGTDLDTTTWSWARDLVSKTWIGHQVSFPAYSRELEGTYHSVRSEDFHRKLLAVLGDAVTFDATVVELGAHHVRLESGETIEAGCVVDARGFAPYAQTKVAYQKFIGWDVRLESPHGLVAPLLMDATVPQVDGYRFIYLLPWSETEILIEDTHYSDGPELDPELYRREIEAYAVQWRWKIASFQREERGVLPIPLAKSFAAFPAREYPVIGVRCGVFNPTTGYSFPDAVATADWIAAEPELTSEALTARLEARAAETRKQRWFFRLLNRMLFRGAVPEERYRVLERFYRLPEDLIARFYSSRLTWADYTRLLVGRPPLPVSRAIGCLSEGETAHA